MKFPLSGNGLHWWDTRTEYMNWPPHPLSRVPPPLNRRRGNILACGWERGGVPIPTAGEKFSNMSSQKAHEITVEIGLLNL